MYRKANMNVACPKFFLFPLGFPHLLDSFGTFTAVSIPHSSVEIFSGNEFWLPKNSLAWIMLGDILPGTSFHGIPFFNPLISYDWPMIIPKYSPYPDKTKLNYIKFQTI